MSETHSDIFVACFLFRLFPGYLLVEISPICSVTGIFRTCQQDHHLGRCRTWLTRWHGMVVHYPEELFRHFLFHRCVAVMAVAGIL